MPAQRALISGALIAYFIFMKKLEEANLTRIFYFQAAAVSVLLCVLMLF